MDDPYALPLGEAGLAYARRWLAYLIELFGPIAVLFARPALEGRARQVLLSGVRRLEIFVRRLILAEAEKLSEMLPARRNQSRKPSVKDIARQARASGIVLTLVTPRPVRLGYVRANPPPALPSARASLRLASRKARKKSEASGKPLLLPHGNKTLALRLEALRKALADPVRLAKRWRRRPPPPGPPKNAPEGAARLGGARGAKDGALNKARCCAGSRPDASNRTRH